MSDEGYFHVPMKHLRDMQVIPEGLYKKLLAANLDLIAERDALRAELQAARVNGRRWEESYERAARECDVADAALTKVRAELDRLTKERDDWCAKYMAARKELGALKFPDCSGTVVMMTEVKP